MTAESEAYSKLGVSSAKADVEKAASVVDAGIAPWAFCRVMPDVFSNDPSRCVLSHSDGAGTKSIVAYLLYKAKGDARWFEGIAHDALVMNLDDMVCAGATSNFAYVSVINRNAHRIGADVLNAVIAGTKKAIDTLSEYGVEITFCGGETADVGDIVRTVIVDGAMTAQMPRDHLIENKLKPGHKIIALSSAGEPCAYENAENSGIAANGLTLARHTLLNAKKLPAIEEISDDARTAQEGYTGAYGIDDPLPGSTLSVGEALLSPTRTFAPVLNEILRSDRDGISGIVHLSGGGHFKSLKFARNVTIVKEIPDRVPPLFEEMQRLSGLSWMEMAKVFNLGWRFEIYCEPDLAAKVMSVAEKYKIDAREIGYVDIGAEGQRQLDLTFKGENRRDAGKV